MKEELKLLTKQDVATLTGLSVATISKHLRLGTLKATIRKHKFVRFLQTDVENFIINISNN